MALKENIRSSLRKLGWDLRRYNPKLDLVRQRLQAIEQQRVEVVLDIGANQGQYGRELRRSGYRGKMVSFEPVQEAFATLRSISSADPDWQCLRVALGSFDGTAEINIGSETSISSLLPPSPTLQQAAPALAMVEREEVQVVRLDSLRSKLSLTGNCIYVKMDVQGYEKAVLDGAQQTLTDVAAIEVELSLRELYRGQWVAHDAFQWLHSRHFVCVSLVPGFADATTGHLLQMDALFIREELP